MLRQNSKREIKEPMRRPSINKESRSSKNVSLVSSSMPIAIKKAVTPMNKGKNIEMKEKKETNYSYNNINKNADMSMRRPIKVSESSFISGVRSSTPKHKTSMSQNLKRRNKFTRDEAVKVIQRNVRLFLYKVRSDPKYEMSKMLKKKKLKILKSYRILDTKDYNKTVDDICKTNIPVSNKSTLNDEDRVTGNFANFVNVYPGNIHNNKPEEKDNFIDDYESFLSYDKKPNSLIKKEDTQIKDENLDKLQKSLDIYSKSKRESEDRKDCSANIDKEITKNDISANIDKEITKNDISDTVNVYEKIFKEIKKENVSNAAEKLDFSYEENVGNTGIISGMKEAEDLKIEELESKSETTIKPIDITPSNIVNENIIKNMTLPFDYVVSPNLFIDEKKKMVERLNSMLDTEEIKSDINTNLNTSNRIKDLSNPNIYLPPNKINQIHSMLEQESVLIAKAKSPMSIDDPYNKNTAEVLNMALELKESKRTIETMKEIIEELKKDSKSREQSAKLEIEEKLKIQKFDFENTLQRQSGLIESLLAEKKKLSLLLEEATEKLDTVDKISHKKISSLVENFDLELKKNKDAWFQAEKMRRKKWEEQKVKEIKEVTVKGLEPEIERIINSHKAEMTKMEDRLHEDLRRQRDKINADWEKRIIEVKERFTKEKEEALEHERTLHNQRLRNQNERLEEEYNEERRRWNAHFTAELERLEALREKDKKLYEDQINKIESRNNLSTEERDNFYKSKLTEMEKRFDERAKDHEDSFKSRFEKEKEKFIEEKSREFEQKLKEAKNELIRDRDKQIQIIIEKLGDETIQERKKIQVDCERKADEINKSLKIENENMKNEIQKLSDKLTAESKVRLMLDENLDTLSKKIQDKEREVSKKEKQLLELNSNYNDINLKYSNIVKDFNREKLDFELDYKAKLQKAESDFKLLMEKLDSVKNYYESKINDIQTVHKSEVVDIEEKIKKTLNRKDEFLKKLQEENAFKDITIQKYEDLLAKQRKELLMSK